METLETFDDLEKNKIEKMLGFFAVVSMRVNIGIAMTCMVNSTAVTINQMKSDISIHNDSIPKINTNSDVLIQSDSTSKITMKPEISSYLTESSIKVKEERSKCSGNTNDKNQPLVNDYGGTLIWSPSIQGWVFSSGFYGCLIAMLPSGYLADTQSPKLLLTIAVICYLSGTALTPVLALYGGWMPLFVDRLIMGMGDGIAIPAINKMVTFWIPVEEKSTAATIYTTGFSLATIIGVPFFAYLCGTPFGWPAIFYICAIFGGIWAVIWHFFSSTSPYECRYITEKEKRYLLSKPELRKQERAQKLQIPFRDIFTSPAFLSLVGCAFTSNIVVTFIHLYLPTFYKEVLFLSPVDNGIFGAIPPICEMIFRFALSILMDFLKQRKILSPTAAVKISQALSGFTIPVLFIALSYVASCDRPFVTLALFCGITMANSAIAAGFFTSLLSIAPAFTGIICSSTFVIGMTSRVLTPAIVPLFVKMGTLEEWRPFFFIIAGSSVNSTEIITTQTQNLNQTHIQIRAKRQWGGCGYGGCGYGGCGPNGCGGGCGPNGCGGGCGPNGCGGGLSCGPNGCGFGPGCSGSPCGGSMNCPYGVCGSMFLAPASDADWRIDVVLAVCPGVPLPVSGEEVVTVTTIMGVSEQDIGEGKEDMPSSSKGFPKFLRLNLTRLL
ncbi:hypothetical protein FO519_004522 [Halicephalobus sp. NKZ332]|nr:hypothetical protein FO519_004522 [Halicephalobus sp. NKZ332]